MTPDFTGFPKVPRLNRECLVLEKIDGTNASVKIIGPSPKSIVKEWEGNVSTIEAQDGHYAVFAASRNRWITPDQDNHGFAKWVENNAAELALILGPGHHFGEWWGSGINRGYGLKNGEKRFSLFNTLRWHNAGTRAIWAGEKWSDLDKEMIPFFTKEAPACCEVVPILRRGLFSTVMVEDAVATLRAQGSFVSGGFMQPEGVIVYHVAGNQYFKVTLDKDQEPKGK
jgi:hypothetical protein